MNQSELVIRDFDQTDLEISNLDPVFRRVLAARGVTSISQTDYQLKNCLPPSEIRYLLEAAGLICDCIQQQKKIVIFGDYDADGATSTALCVRALNLMHHANVDYLMPDRFIDGYGLSPGVAERIANLRPDCVITVDNGIASIDGVALLREADVEVVITDHHLPGESLPDASVIVNQNAWSDVETGRNLAGVGIAFYLMLAVRTQLRDLGWFNAQRLEPNLAVCLDLVAIGSVADLVPLDYHNRILVSEGLKRIRAGACCEGVKALILVVGKHLDNFTSTDIAFALAPRINAAGRLEDMTVGVQCLLADTTDSAIALSNELNDINAQRREIQQQMSEEAAQQLNKFGQTDPGKQKSIVLHQADWHEGIVGIVASKLKEKYHRPTIVFATAEDGQLRGSGRSISGIHLRDILDLVNKRLPGSILKFGGHAMAAGLTLRIDSLSEFIDVFEMVITEFSDPACFNVSIECDGELDAQQLNLSFASDLQDLSPWGQRFPMPSFVGTFEVLSHRILSGQHLKLTLALTTAGYEVVVDAIAFFQPAAILQREFSVIRIHYELNVNRFRGIDSVQLLIRDIIDT